MYNRPDGGLGGVERFRAANDLSRRDALRLLQRSGVYKLHKPARKKFEKCSFIVTKVNDLRQADLSDVSKYKGHNRGHRYLLVVIDTLSWFLYVLPIKTKHSQDVKKAFVRIFRGENVPVHLMTDRGREFHNHVLSDLFRKKGINHYSTCSDMKAASAKREIGTIKEKLFRFFRSSGTYAYLAVLPRLVADYNNSVYRITKMKPKDVSTQNEVALLNRINAKKKSTRKFKYKVGDQV